MQIILLFYSFEDDNILDEIQSDNAGVGEILDPSVYFYPEPYCQIFNSMHTACFEKRYGKLFIPFSIFDFIFNFFSILELFGTPGGYNFPEDFFRTLTQQDILNAVNTRNLSGVFLSERNYASLLGGVQRNESGHIISAKSTYIAWFTELDTNGEKDSGRDLGLDDNADEGTLEFELELRKILESQCDLPEGLYSYANVHRSFGDISTKAIWDDVTYMVIGYMMLYAFVQIMIGRFNKVEQRVNLMRFKSTYLLPFYTVWKLQNFTLIALYTFWQKFREINSMLSL